jgi:hypothetical protein
MYQGRKLRCLHLKLVLRHHTNKSICW